MYCNYQNLLITALIFTTMVANILARKMTMGERDGFRFHQEYDNDNNNKHGGQVATSKRGSCQGDCQENKEMCLTHTDMNNFSEKFACLAQYSFCNKKCHIAKREVDEDTSNRNDGEKKIIIDAKILRQLYRSMPKELLIDLLLSEQRSSSDSGKSRI